MRLPAVKGLGVFWWFGTDRRASTAKRSIFVAHGRLFVAATVCLPVCASSTYLPHACESRSLVVGAFFPSPGPMNDMCWKKPMQIDWNRYSGHEHWWGSPIPQLYGIRLPNLRCYLHWQNFHQPSKDGILVWSEPGSEITIAPVKILAIPHLFHPKQQPTMHQAHQANQGW